MQLNEACDRVEIHTVIDSFVAGLDRIFGPFPIRLDLAAIESVLALFTEEGILHTPFGRTVGREAIGEGWSQVAGLEAPGGQTKYVRHHITTREVVLDDAESAHATVYVQGLTERGIDHWGYYEDRFVRTTQGWRIAEKLVIVEDCIAGGYYAGLPGPVNPTRSW